MHCETKKFKTKNRTSATLPQFQTFAFIYIDIYICIYIRFEDVFLERHKRLIVSEAD